ncbi:hypothetical protein SAMN05880566_112202 [Janthinobacterium sp. TND4EL3]|uniref:hypothetical protein n=1 Tax=Janthinobacterium sp. TND4EL3 TaxID=1907311 RepID=UPI000953A47B|nr:hypothetical protein [Janthinobacterium sp. TND4EL3]SIR43533.1 hypothetical protein SAMN05880566_112202 [Janthinobacterium sp. TND4EL3]
MSEPVLFAAWVTQLPEQIIDLIARGPAFDINYIGGNCSQDMVLPPGVSTESPRCGIVREV